MRIRRSWSGWPGSYEPAGSFTEMRQDLQRLIEGLEGGSRMTSAGVYPSLNVTEDPDQYFVRAELPGMDANKLSISAFQNKLEVAGERELTEEQDGGSYHRRERVGGPFSRSVTLPTEIDSDRVEANYVNGILTIALPKAEDKKPRQIAIKAS